jgi:putative toxin-antitoxin system antitoxin component (TIGR02293 family)
MDIEQRLDKEISTLFKPLADNKRLEKDEQNLTYNEFLSNKMLIIKLIRTGVPYSLFDLIRNVTPFSEMDWAEFLNLSTKSLHRYKQDAKHFKPLQSEKIIEMAEVTNIGVEVFGNMEKFKLWLDTPNFALGSLKPMELLKDSYGKEMVIGELTRINHGILV